MKWLLSLAAAIGISAATMTMVGCESTGSASHGDMGAMAGGNGEFGENPAHPGSYNGDRYSVPPATQPSR